MKRINFLVTDTLNHQIESAMQRLGINSKSEFFRLLAITGTKESSISPPLNNTNQQSPSRKEVNEPLTDKEERIFKKLQKGPQSINDLVDETSFSVPEVSSLLMQLLLKDRAVPQGAFGLSKLN